MSNEQLNADNFEVIDAVDEGNEIDLTAEDDAPVIKNEQELTENGTNEQMEEEDSFNKCENEQSKADNHPYLYLIESFEFQKDQLRLTEVGSAKNITQTQFHFINTRESFIRMLQSLRNSTEIAVDFQSNNDYQGTIVIISISTSEVDYCIDVPKLRNELLMLTEIFLSPRILKILFRGKIVLSSFQIKFHLYMVNIFDLEEARIALGEAVTDNGTLNHILKTEYNFTRPQLSKPDFSHRPLSEEYRLYCRSSSHFLINIYHNYKNKLIVKNLDSYKKFLEVCRNACKVVHIPSQTESFENVEKELKKRHECELELLKRLYEWRNETAKRLNLKPLTVLFNRGLLILARNFSTNEGEIAKLTQSQYVKQDIEKIKEIVEETLIKFDLDYKRRIIRRGKKRKVQPQHKPKPVDSKNYQSSKKTKKNVTNQKNQFNSKNKKRPRFQRKDGMNQGSYSNPVLVNSTSIPSSFTFQAPKNDFSSPGPSSNFLPFNNNKNRGNSNNWYNNSNNSRNLPNFDTNLREVDQKIQRLERQIQLPRQGQNFRQNQPVKRYFHY